MLTQTLKLMIKFILQTTALKYTIQSVYCLFICRVYTYLYVFRRLSAHVNIKVEKVLILLCIMNENLPRDA